MVHYGITRKNGSQPIFFLVSGSFYSSDMTAIFTAYDLESEITMEVPDLNKARWYQINCIVCDYLIVAGGKDALFELANSIELLDLTKLKDDWSSGQKESSWSLVSYPVFGSLFLFVPRICCQLK